MDVRDAHGSNGDTSFSFYFQCIQKLLVAFAFLGFWDGVCDFQQSVCESRFAMIDLSMSSIHYI